MHLFYVETFFAQQASKLYRNPHNVRSLLQATCTETARIITESDGTAKAYRCDVTNVDDVANMAARVRREVGDVDILVNNAGVLVVKNILELSDDEIRRTMNVNAVSQFWVIVFYLRTIVQHVHVECQLRGPPHLRLSYVYEHLDFYQ